MVDVEKYYQSMVSQLVMIEKDLRSTNETLLCLLIQEIELNKLTLRTLQVQFNVMKLEPKEIEEEFDLLFNLVKVYSNKAKEISNNLCLPRPDKGEEE